MNNTSNSGTEKKASDLKVRLISAAAMALVAGFALWVGSWLFAIFVILIALAIIFEWYGLVGNFGYSKNITYFWLALGVIYIGYAAFTLVYFRLKDVSYIPTLMLLLVVIATDAGAYFAGRRFGKRKLAPKISPGKTWEGLVGGMIAAGLIWCIYSVVNNSNIWYEALLSGMAMAILAQVGDLFESWMKRKAGKKDSSNILPGHGGLFDRADGILAVFFILGVFHIPLFWDNF